MANWTRRVIYASFFWETSVTTAQFINRLASETSPYLLQHVQN